MSPFDANLDNDAGHTIDQDDLIAFHLHELSPQQELALHRVLESSPSLQAESLAIAATLHAFPKHEPSPTNLNAAAASNRIWQSLRPNLTAYIPAAATPLAFLKLPMARWAIPTAAAAVFASTALILTLHHKQPTKPTTVATNTKPLASVASSPFVPTEPVPVSTTNSIAPNVASPIARALHRPSPSAQQSFAQLPALPPKPLEKQPYALPPFAILPSSQTAPAFPNTNPASLSPQSLPPETANSTSASTASSAQLSEGRLPKVYHPHPADLTLAVFGNLADSHASTSTFLQEESKVVGVLASYHQQLHPLLGYRITTTYSRSAFTYTNVAPNTISEGIYELSGTYTVQGPHSRRINSSLEAGGGLVAFSSINPYQSTTANTHTFRPAAVIGAATELALSKHWALRAEYRALFYRTPDIYPSHYPANGTPTPGNVALTFSSQPTIGITYRFR
jgi:hypothetical protein